MPFNPVIKFTGDFDDLEKGIKKTRDSLKSLSTSTMFGKYGTFGLAVTEAKRLTTEMAKQQKIAKQISDEIQYGKFGAMGRNAAPHVANGLKIAGAIIASTSALTFAAAAAAGSTTFDTLTGSLKMLSLAAGAKTQGAVLNISKWIQQFSHVVEKADAGLISGSVGALTGAGIGYRFGGFKGAAIGGAVGAGAGLIATGDHAMGGALLGGTIGSYFGPAGALLGAAIGDLAGTIKQTKFKGDYEDDLATRFARDPELAGKALGKAAVLDKQGDRGPAAAEMLRKAVAKSEVMRKADPEGFLTAGLPGGGTSVGLTEYRNESTTGGAGALGMKNLMTELKNNLNAISAGSFAVGWSANPQNVAPPGQP